MTERTRTAEQAPSDDAVYERHPFRVLIDHEGDGHWVPYNVYALSVDCWSDDPLEIVTESSLVIRAREVPA